MSKIIKSDCVHLKTKKSHIPDISKPDKWRTNESTTGSYWCIKSMQTLGPDGGLVSPENCQSIRDCFSISR